MERPTEPLRWELTPPEVLAGSYRLRMIGPGGEPPSKVLRVFEGNPTLYLTADALFQGPSKGRGPFDHQKDHLVPVAAVESSEIGRAHV